MSQTSYTKRSVNNQKLQKFVPVLEGNLSVKNAPKLSAKYLQEKTCKIKANAKHSIHSEDIFKSTKNVSKNVAPKRAPLILPHLNFKQNL